MMMQKAVLGAKAEAAGVTPSTTADGAGTTTPIKSSGDKLQSIIDAILETNTILLDIRSNTGEGKAVVV